MRSVPSLLIAINSGITLPKDALIDPEFAGLGAEEIYARLLKRAQDSVKAEAAPESSAQPATEGGIGSGKGRSRHPKTCHKSRNHRSRNRKIRPNRGEFRLNPAPARSRGFGEVLDAVGDDGEPASQAEMTRQMHEWAVNAEQALCSAKACGHMPAGIERPIEESRQSAQDWRAILHDFIAATSPSDYRWAPPNRRFISAGLYPPIGGT